MAEPRRSRRMMIRQHGDEFFFCPLTNQMEGDTVIDPWYSPERQG